MIRMQIQQSLNFISSLYKQILFISSSKKRMNTEERLFLLNNFSGHLKQKISKIQRQKDCFLKSIQNHDINFDGLPKIDIVSDLALYHKDIDSTINQTYSSISSVMDSLATLKNKKQNTQKLQDILSSISLIKTYSITLKIQNLTDLNELFKALNNYFQVRSKAKYCQSYINQIDEQIVKIQEKYRKQFNNQLTKTNSNSIKDLAKILQLIKINKMDIKEQKDSGKNATTRDGQKQQKKALNVESLSQISEFYVGMVRKQLSKFQEQLFIIPIISSNPNEMSYVFFQIIKNSLKIVASIIQTYQSNIIKLQSFQGLHNVIVNVFKYTMENLVLQTLARQKKYYQIDKIVISRNKLTIKTSQYKILKNYFKEFNAIWNQIQRFRLHLYGYLGQKQYEGKNIVNKELSDIINNSRFVEFNYQIILYFQAFFRHQLDRLLKKSPFVLSLWQLDEEFFKDVRQKKQYKSNLAGQDFIQQMILKFSEGIKKSFETLNILIVSALINFVNHNLINEDSFYAFNELFGRFTNRITESKSIQGMVILMNTVSFYPKAIKSSFHQLQIPDQLPQQRIQNEISQLIHSCSQKTGDFIVDAFDKILSQEYILQKITSQSNLYQELVTKLFQNLQKDLLELFVYKISKVHVQLILQQQFREKYSHMEVLALEKQIRNVINFYQSKSHSIRNNFRKILDYIEVLLIQNQSGLKKLIQQWKDRYQQAQLRNMWKLRSQN